MNNYDQLGFKMASKYTGRLNKIPKEMTHC